jgi:AAHS family 3-hydroxyphenylpropionic acid transporter
MALPNFLRPTDRFTVADRRILFLLGIVAFVAGYTGSQMAHTLPFARLSLDMSEGAMSLAFAGVRAASLLGVGFAIVADRRGRRRPLIAAFTLLAAGSLLTAFVPVAAIYVVAQSAVRIGVVAIAGVGLVFLAEELTPGVRAYGIGLYGLAGSLGVGTGLLILPLAERADEAWRVLFALGGLGLLALPLLLRFLPESRAYRPGAPIRFVTALRMGLNKHFWPLAGASFFVAAFAAPAFDFVLERLISDLGWQAGAARFLLIITSGLGAIGLLVGGRAADRVGRRPTAVAAMLIGLVGGLGFYLLDSGWFLAASIFLATLGATMLTPALGAMRAELFPTKVRATAAGWVTNVAILGSIAGFLVGALLIDRIGLSATVAILGVGIVGAVLLTLRLPETRGMDIVRARPVPRPAAAKDQS